MNAGRFQRIEKLFHEAVALDSKSRGIFLDRACGGDAELRGEIESLLAQCEQAESFLESRRLEATQTLAYVHSTRTGGALVGHQLGSYRILSPLGAGGMGEVYRAHDDKLGRDVALKTLPREFARDPDRLARFRREARTLAALNHPNIAAIHGLEESEEATCLVLELVEGETLCGPLPVNKVLDYARQIAEALEAAHEKGIVHRDLKPANIKVTPEGRVKVLDFGLAKAVWGGNESQNASLLNATVGPETVVGNVVGTPPYMSPEQARGGEVDKRTDIWAFGCVLFELLTGKRAFRGNTVGDTLRAILEREPEWTALPAKMPPKLRDLLKRCLHRDIASRIQDIRDARGVIEKIQKGRNRWQLAAVAAGLVALAAVGAALWLRGPGQPVARDEWVQLTKFPDSVSQAALSSDGHMIAFVRGPSTFEGPGQIYVKMLPNGEPKQLTNDDLHKMSPVFSPDGTRIAYTTVNQQSQWDTWTVPVLGGEPHAWLVNAEGLVWKDTRTILFSEILSGGHMALKTAEESRASERNVYTPAPQNGMAHRSYPSPDGKWVLIAEMAGPWLPCRLVPMDGSSAGNPVGPRGAACTFAAWSPDGKWMYFSSSAGGSFHTWRQRFPDGVPQQITSGPTEEEGIAMAPNGRSFITAMGQRQRPVSLHMARGDRQISIEGYAYDPRFAPGFKKLCYRILKGSQPSSDPTELWIADLESGSTEELLPGYFVLGGGHQYSFSPDGREVVFAGSDRDQKSRRLWLAPVDRPSVPQPIPNTDGGQMPYFAPGSEIYFLGEDGFVYQIRRDGTGKRRLHDEIVTELQGLSPDGKWIVGGHDRVDFAFPTGGGPPVAIRTNVSRIRWSQDGKLMFIQAGGASMGSGAVGRNYAFPLKPGKMLPDVPPGGFRSEEEMAKYPGVRLIDVADISPGPTPDVYAFSKETTQRNLYRIPLR